MKVSVITTSVGGWDKLIKPMIISIRKYEPGVEIVVVDCGDNYPDEFMGAKIIKTGLLNCSAAQNVGMEHTDADWFLVSDCDVICEGDFTHLFEYLDKDTIWGNKLHVPNNFGFGKYNWLDGWIYAFSRKLYEDIGGFDENFQGSGFEDADICWRAIEKGYKINFGDFPFRHLEVGQKRSISDGYDDVRLKNIEYLRKKHDV